MRWLGLLLIVGLLAGCAHNGSVTYAVGTLPGYLLDTGDQVRVTVYGEPQLSSTYTVTDRGTLVLPLADAIPVRGQSIATAQERIRAKLAEGYMLRPHVALEVAQYRPFFVEGSVERPGKLEFEYGMTVRSAVTTAGGFNEFADKSHAVIYRRGGATMTRMRVKLDTPIHPGDLVLINERWL